MFAMIYLTITIVYTALMTNAWLDKAHKYFEWGEFREKKFRTLFRVYDLALPLFPITLFVVILIVIVYTCENFDRINENRKNKGKKDYFFNRPLFK